jgi:hypothetical protein
VLLIAILIVLSLLFGGFHKGTKAGSLGQFHDHGQFGAHSGWRAAGPGSPCPFT